MRTHTFALFAGVLALGGCIDGFTDASPIDTGLDTDTDVVDSDSDADTDTPIGPPMFVTSGWSTDWTDAVTLDCAASTPKFTLTLRTEPTGYDAEFYMADTRFTKDYDEEHTFEDDSATDFSYSVFERTLTPSVAFASAMADVNSVFKCVGSNADAGSNFKSTGTGGNFNVTYAARVDDVDGNLSDCIVFGYNPAELLDGTPPAGLNVPSWVTANNCRNVNPVPN